MPVALELHDGRHITYSAALNKEENIKNQILEVSARNKLYEELWNQRHTIEGLVKHHLGLGNQAKCAIAPTTRWIRGSFNVCIPLAIKSANSSTTSLMFRCAMPHKLAEAKHPGAVDEKVGSEVGTYVWMQSQCPEIRIPHLYGFGFTNHLHFTHEQHRPFYIRFVRIVQRFFRCLRPHPPILSSYTNNQTHHRLPTAYMLLEYIGPETGQMLSNTWGEYHGDPVRRGRLFHGLARLVLSLARVPQPRTGSFQFHQDCTITLSNRPLSCSTMILENNGAPRTIPKDTTYTCTDPFVADMLTFHDGSFLSNPNAVSDDDDCKGQMAAKTLLRAVSPHYVKQEHRAGPFLLQLTDLHASNIFVDKDWNVTTVIDLEWVCALPIEMLAVPYWLTGRGIDEIVGDYLQDFNEVRQEFMHALEEEESRIAHRQLTLAPAMHASWESGAVWFWRCLSSVNATYSLVDDHISPQFSRLSWIVAQLLTDQAFELVGRDRMPWTASSRDTMREYIRAAVVEGPAPRGRAGTPASNIARWAPTAASPLPQSCYRSCYAMGRPSASPPALSSAAASHLPARPRPRSCHPDEARPVLYRLSSTARPLSGQWGFRGIQDRDPLVPEATMTPPAMTPSPQPRRTARHLRTAVAMSSGPP
ncbi:hypothetical protein JX266_014210 [Neoarthrinium moseri]|nr:hypothetical protein JX266_014210 [Neoarthrinium moseri]